TPQRTYRSHLRLRAGGVSPEGEPSPISRRKSGSGCEEGLGVPVGDCDCCGPGFGCCGRFGGIISLFMRSSPNNPVESGRLLVRRCHLLYTVFPVGEAVPRPTRLSAIRPERQS